MAESGKNPEKKKVHKSKYIDDGVLCLDGDHELEITLDIEKCFGCKICELVCPREAISGEPVKTTEDKIIVAPKIDNSECRDCYSCIMACPSEALELYIDGNKIDKDCCPHLDWNDENPITGEIKIDKCAAHCRACVDVCPEEALYIRKQYSPEGNIGIDIDLCNYCGACQKVCDYKDYRHITMKITGVHVSEPTKKLEFPYNSLIVKHDILINLKKLAARVMRTAEGLHYLEY